ncbi:peptidoglycan editing factor PgeF [Brassicibacter mesophilus]|uniref:peptidoglycan editing factor PgeF n=1 Tax=Brassicibacter mesophilus TaxID=745119 RepID=UPI003D1EE160
MDYDNRFVIKEKKGVKFYTICSFEKTGLVSHAFTTRIGGVSSGSYSSMNLGIKTDDDFNDVKHNFNIIADLFNTSLDKIVLSNQVHGTNIRIIDEVESKKDELNCIDDGVDGLVTNIKNIMICTFYADCVPIFYLDPINKVVALAHAGWRGTVNKIAGKMVDIMQHTYNSIPEDILVGIGPSIGPCCYEVNSDVYNKFNENFTNNGSLLKQQSPTKWQLNLWEANKIVLEEKGIISRNITVSKICTSCNSDEFFSYRKDSGVTGRMAAIIQLI